MTDRFIIELGAEGDLQSRLAAAIQGVERPRALMEAIGARMEANVNARFDSKRAPDGTAWLPLAASTKASYEAKFNGKVPGTLLERTRRMRNSLSYQAGDVSVEWGFSVPYAAWHELGTMRMPRRQLLADDPIAGTLGQRDREDVVGEVEAFLAGLLGT